VIPLGAGFAGNLVFRLGDRGCGVVGGQFQ
jgi:hypothetical protein